MNPPFSIPLAKACLDASALSYDKATVQSSLSHALIQEREVEPEPGMPPERYLLIAFRGTEKIKDWMTDGRIALVTESERPEPGRSLGRVHLGFSLSLSSVMERVEARAVDFPGRILLTGHSKGGAEAVLCAKKLHADFRMRVAGVYTFGQPRVGDADFAGLYQMFLGDRTFRFVNEEDLVPRVPFPGIISNYRHAGREIFFPSNRKGFEADPSLALKLISDRAGWARDFLLGQASCITDHFVTHYQARFQKEFSSAKSGPDRPNANYGKEVAA